MRRSHRLQLAALALVAAACSDATGPAAPVTDITSALAEMSLSSIIPAFVPTTVRGMNSSPAPSLVPSQCAYEAASQSFVCGTTTANGLTFNRSYALLAASGAPQTAFDAATTASIRTMFTASGTISTGGFSETLDARSTMTLSGLLTGAHVLDGTDVTHSTSPGFNGGTRASTTTATITGLIPAPAGDANRYPRAGSIAIAFDETVTGSPPMRFTITMAFNGTSKVAATYTSNGGAPRQCTIDLAATGAAGFSSCFSAT